MSCPCIPGNKTNTRPRRCNYQKLVDVEKPIYGSFPPEKRNSKNGSFRKSDESKKKSCFEIQPCVQKLKICGGIPTEQRESKCGNVRFKVLGPCSEQERGGSNHRHIEQYLSRIKPTADTGKKIMLCLPCDKDKMKRPEPDCLKNVTVYFPRREPATKPKKKQTDYLYRCESRELRGSNLYTYCLCVKRNGLQDECPRTPCQGRPACLVRPWPDCWPSGGCYGIDYTRPNGTERVNPTLQYRFDNKKCGPNEDRKAVDVRLVLAEADPHCC